MTRGRSKWTVGFAMLEFAETSPLTHSMVFNLSTEILSTRGKSGDARLVSSLKERQHELPENRNVRYRSQMLATAICKWRGWG
jgi:hypothetical protein